MRNICPLLALFIVFTSSSYAANKYVAKTYERAEQIEVSRKATNLDPTKVWFGSSLTAKIWRQLVDGKKFYEIDNEDTKEDFLKKYIAKYKPSSLLSKD